MADDAYDSSVEHPRFGKAPRITGLNPREYGRRFSLDIIPNTAIAADLSRQTRATIPVPYYFDTKRFCRDCHRPFLFFAAEQKYWYEELGFGLDSNCVRCPECRQQQHGLARLRARYEELCHVADRSLEQNLELAECCLSLAEQGEFHSRQTAHVRMLLNRARTTGGSEKRIEYLLARVRKLS